VEGFYDLQSNNYDQCGANFSHLDGGCGFAR
jgi:hypothetical protein